MSDRDNGDSPVEDSQHGDSDAPPRAVIEASTSIKDGANVNYAEKDSQAGENEGYNPTHEKTRTDFSLRSVEKQKEMEDAAKTIYKKIVASPPPIARTPRRPTITVRVSATKREVWDNAASNWEPSKTGGKEKLAEKPKLPEPMGKQVIPVIVSKSNQNIWDLNPPPKSIEDSQVKRRVNFSGATSEATSPNSGQNITLYPPIPESEGDQVIRKEDSTSTTGQWRKSIIQVQTQLNRKLEVWESVLPTAQEDDAQSNNSQDEEQLESDEERVSVAKETLAKPKAVYRPRSSYTTIQQWFFAYMNTFARDCASHDLNLSQYPSIEREDNSKIIGSQFLEAWYTEHRPDDEKPPKISSVVFKFFGTQLLLAGIPYFLESLTRIGQAFFFGLLLDSLRSNELFSPSYSSVPKDGMLGSSAALLDQSCKFAAILCGLAIVQYVLSQSKYFYSMRTGMQFRVALTASLFQKALKLPSHAFSHAQITSLMTGDLQKIEEAAQYVHYLWVGPIETVIILILLWTKIGIASFASIGIILLLVLIQLILAQSLFEIRGQINHHRDDRIEKLSNMVSSIVSVKLYAWEDALVKKIEDIRKLESEWLQKSTFRKAISGSLFFAASSLAPIIAFVVFYLQGGVFTPTIVFQTCLFMSLVRQTMVNNFCKAAQCALEFNTTMMRLQQLFETPELTIKNDTTLDDFQDSSVVFVMKDATFSRGTQTTTDGQTVEAICLQNISLKLKKGELTGICGPLGGGKSSLLDAIIGEVNCIGGTLGCVAESIAFVSQKPWIIAGSYKDNITFGKPYRKEWFDEVVKACCLDVDFATLPEKENAKVDERGQNLSGGVKARVSLARAIYSNADIYLLDDPFSNVDSKVSKQIFQNCVKTVLKKKTVLLASHTVSYMQHCDHVIILEGGKISASGTFSAVKGAVDSPFAIALQSHPSSLGAGPDNASPSIDNTDRQLRRLSLAKRRSIRASSVGGRDLDNDPIGVGKSESVQITFQEYLRIGASNSIVVLIICFFLISQAFAMTADYWLAMWTDDLAPSKTGTLSNSLIFYIVFGGITLVFAVARAIIFYSSALNSSETVFQQMLYSVFHAHSYFIQKTPFGRIVNRFAKDIADTDEVLPQASFDLMQRLLIMIGTFILIAVAIPWTLLVYPFIILTFFLYMRTYLSAIRRVKRLEAATRSPIYTSMIVALEGKATIRAFKAEERLHDKFCLVQNEHTRVHFASLNMARWLGVKADGLSCIFLVILVFGAVLLENTLQLPGSYIGLMIYCTLQLFDGVQGCVKQSAEVENLMAAVRRVVEFAVNLPQESLQGEKPNDSWPERGEITISNLSLRYPDSDFDTLSNITVTIPAGKKTCILGRTGAGKSTLMQTIFRLYEPVNDSILIDDVPISELSLFYLRSRLAIIPQEPICFHGSIRFNLDPYADYTDDKLWAALELVNLKPKVVASNVGLEFPISQNGENLSAGEKQLLSLARAVLRQPKIIVMDEATSSIDIESDKIFHTVFDTMQNVTIISVVHSIASTAGYDEVLVLNRGLLVENGPPAQLLKKDPTEAGSWFGRMASMLSPEELADLKSKFSQ